jgi:hypothetical protein
LVGTRIGSQAVVGVGLGLDVFSDNPKILGLGLELRALPVLVGQNVLQLNAKGDVESRPTDGVLVPAEWLVSAHSGLLMDGALDVQAGVGSALPLSGAIPMTVPGVRMVLGLRYIPTNKPKKVPPPPPPVPAKAPEPDVEKPSPLSPFGQGPVQAIDQTPVGPSAASGGHPTPPPPPTGSTTIPWLPSDKKPIPTETLSETKDGNRDGVSGGGKKKPGQLNLATPTGRSHRIFVDGRLVNGKGQLLIPLSCGKHLVKVGRTGKPKEIDVPCGGEVMLE